MTQISDKSDRVAPTGGGIVLTAAHIAVALVAACRHLGICPTSAFQPQTRASRARRIAAAGCVARLGVSARAAANLFRIQAIRLAPTKLRDAGITTDDLLVVAEALEKNGLTLGDDAAARFRKPQPKPPIEVASAPARTARPATPRPRVVSVTADPTPASPRPGPTPKRSVPVLRSPRPPQPSGVARASRPAAPRSPSPPRTIQLKPVTDRIVRWTMQQMRLGVSVDLMADLFDVDVEVLARLAGPVQSGPEQAVAA